MYTVRVYYVQYYNLNGLSVPLPIAICIYIYRIRVIHLRASCLHKLIWYSMELYSFIVPRNICPCVFQLFYVVFYSPFEWIIFHRNACDMTAYEINRSIRDDGEIDRIGQAQLWRQKFERRKFQWPFVIRNPDTGNSVFPQFLLISLIFFQMLKTIGRTGRITTSQTTQSDVIFERRTRYCENVNVIKSTIVVLS